MISKFVLKYFSELFWDIIKVINSLPFHFKATVHMYHRNSQSNKEKVSSTSLKLIHV